MSEERRVEAAHAVALAFMATSWRAHLMILEMALNNALSRNPIA